MITIPEQYAVQIFYQFVSTPSYNRLTKAYNGSCPFCKEGKSFGKKRRFFYIPKVERCYCHNCGYSKKVVNFIIDVTGKPFNIVLSEIEQSDYTNFKVPEQEQKKETVTDLQIKTLPDDCINLFDKTQIQFYKDNAIVHIALRFIASRRLHKAINRPKTFYLSLNDRTHKNRLVLPFYDENGKIIFYQTRTLLDADNHRRPKYLSKIGGNKTLYGIHSIDSTNDYIFLLEGPIDSFFIRNGLAVCGIQDESERMFTDLQHQQIEQLKMFKRIWVLDNQWCDEAAYKKTEILLEQNETVFIWPEEYKQYKDINDYCIDKKIDEFEQKIILDNTYQGLQGLVKLQMLKR